MTSFQGGYSPYVDRAPVPGRLITRVDVQSTSLLVGIGGDMLNGQVVVLPVDSAVLPGETPVDTHIRLQAERFGSK